MVQRQSTKPEADREEPEVDSEPIRKVYDAATKVIKLRRRWVLTEPYARELLRLHRQTYPGFWRWSDGAESQGMLTNCLHTVFG